MKPKKRIIYKKVKPKSKYFRFIKDRIKFAFKLIKEMEDEEYGK